MSATLPRGTVDIIANAGSQRVIAITLQKLFHRQPRPLRDEGIGIRKLRDHFVGRLATAMSGAGFDADQVGLVADALNRSRSGDRKSTRLNSSHG